MAHRGARPGPAFEAIDASIRDYYSARARRYGATPLGVDWTCVPTQELRFVQLLKAVMPAPSVSINDIGCGYGALAGFAHRRLRGCAIDYLGVDLAPEMIALAHKRNRRSGVRFEVGRCASRPADYSLASGAFNVKLYHAEDDWQAMVAEALVSMARASRLAFAVNFIAPGEGGPIELYRPPPERWMDFCRQDLGLEPQLVQGYGLREFTLLVPTRRGSRPAPR